MAEEGRIGRLLGTSHLIACIAVDSHRDEDIAEKLLKILDGDYALRTELAAGAGHLLKHDTLGGVEEKVADIMIESDGFSTRSEGHHERVDLTLLKSNGGIEQEGTHLAALQLLIGGNRRE